MTRTTRLISRSCSEHKRLKFVAFIACFTALAGCHGSPRPLNDDEKIVRAALTLLSSAPQKICLDDETSENSLATFREMALAPRASRQELHWYPPTPLVPDARNIVPRTVSDKDWDKSRLSEAPARTDPLPGLQQMMLNGAALRLSRGIVNAEHSVAISSAWTPSGVTSRWWPINRFRKDCVPRFAISNPLRQKNLAFVAVQANHWGALYAFKPVGDDWVPIAEWSRWLY